MFFQDDLMHGVTNELGISEVDSFIFFTLCPKLQIFEIVQNEAVPGVQYRRYAITKKGIQFFAYLEKRFHKKRLLKEIPSEKEKTKGLTIGKDKRDDDKLQNQTSS